MPVFPSDDDLERDCGSVHFSRGQDYFERHRVLEVRIRDERAGYTRIEGRTEGRGGNVYSTIVLLEERLHDVRVSGQCTCPVSVNCKHAVALCLSYRGSYLPMSGGGVAGVRPEISAALNVWLQGLDQATESLTDGSPSADAAEQVQYRRERLIYIIAPLAPGTGSFAQASAHGDDFVVELRLSYLRARGFGWQRGRIITPQALNRLMHFNASINQALDDHDRRILGSLLLAGPRVDRYERPRLVGKLGFELLEAIVQSERGFLYDPVGDPLVWSPPRMVRWEWLPQDKDYLALTPVFSAMSPSTASHSSTNHSGASHSSTNHSSLSQSSSSQSTALTRDRPIYLRTEPPTYLVQKGSKAGLAQDQDELTAEQREWFQRAPLLPVVLADEFSLNLLRNFPNLPVPPAVEARKLPRVTGTPTPILKLVAGSDDAVEGARKHRLYLAFAYSGIEVAAWPWRARQMIQQKDHWVELHRDRDFEFQAREILAGYGFAEASGGAGEGNLVMATTTDILGVAQWQTFLDQGLPILEAAGWRIVRDAYFSLAFTAGDWSGEVTEESNDWFELRFDLEVDGEVLPLAPLLAPVIEELFGLPDELWPDRLPIRWSDDHYILVPSASLRPVLDVLRELFAAGYDPKRCLRLNRYDADLIGHLGHERALRGAEELQRLADQLRNFAGIESVDPPQGLQAELRHYQQRGLDWLQFLRAYRFNGLLADDMGLGKTLQTLAHLLLEKESGRLQEPALVVAPTSLMGTWRREAERFTPQLRVLVVHGDQRHDRFPLIPEHDLVLTTYPLLSRDQTQLQEFAYSFLVLDEAQHVKNPKTQAAKVLRELRCKHRLCLTGTPMENHLGDLWTHFDFLMPGFLGDHTTFAREFRGPIEHEGNEDRRQRLVRRLRPFLLRRSKAEVATELPPKSEILRTAGFGPAQAQLYESIRVTMDRRVRDAIASRGLARSHITILDALLKLRQICCDPRLLKLEKTHRQIPSAKLELLLELLPKLIEEGRRVLLFSQFAQMLILIEERVRGLGIPYTKLTGSTRDRDAVITRFRSGEVPLFLISLKAGGVGLNLVEADAVILYDPWWNPAVESQAADRAHRIGQDKPVFVYKLVVENSVEEKMIALQEHKRRLAQGIYKEQAADDLPLFDPETLSELFAPIR